MPIVFPPGVGRRPYGVSSPPGGGVAAPPPSAAVTGIDLPGTTDNFVSAPSSTALGMPGTVDIRVHATLDDWTAVGDLAGKWGGGTSGYLFHLSTGGKPSFALAPGGGFQNVVAPNPVGYAPGTPKWLRATWDPADGFVHLFEGDDGSSWTELHSQFTATGSVLAYAPGVAVTVGADSNGASLLAGVVHRVIFIGDGATVGDFDPSQVTKTAARTPATYTDPQGNVWTPGGSAWDWV